MTPTVEQARQAAINTLQKPRNHAPVIYQALRNDKARGGGRHQSSWQMNVTEVTHEV